MPITPSAKTKVSQKTTQDPTKPGNGKKPNGRGKSDPTVGPISDHDHVHHPADGSTFSFGSIGLQKGNVTVSGAAGAAGLITSVDMFGTPNLGFKPQVVNPTVPTTPLNLPSPTPTGGGPIVGTQGSGVTTAVRPGASSTPLGDLANNGLQEGASLQDAAQNLTKADIGSAVRQGAMKGLKFGAIIGLLLHGVINTIKALTGKISWKEMWQKTLVQAGVSAVGGMAAGAAAAWAGAVLGAAPWASFLVGGIAGIVATSFLIWAARKIVGLFKKEPAERTPADVDSELHDLTAAIESNRARQEQFLKELTRAMLLPEGSAQREAELKRIHSELETLAQEQKELEERKKAELEANCSSSCPAWSEDKGRANNADKDSHAPTVTTFAASGSTGA